MSSRLKFHWMCWGTLAALFCMAVTAFELSRASHKAELPLRPGATVSFSVFRLVQSPLAVGIYFKRNGWTDKRPELGSYSYNPNFRESGDLEFKEPGEPITIRITSDSGLDARFLAMPVSRYTGTSMWRGLASNDGGISTRFPWPPHLQTLPRGITHLTVSVADVGSGILSENVTFVVEAPISGHGWLGWLYFWPLFAVPLFIYGGTLLSPGYRSALEQAVGENNRIFRCAVVAIAKIGAAIVLAYPLSGLAAATWVAFHDFPRLSLQSAFFIAVWIGTSAPLHGVLPDIDSADHYHFPAYHFVILTAAVLIIVFFRGWRLFTKRRASQ